MSWHMIWTLLLIIAFIGIVVWAYSSRRKSDFDEAARLPLEEDDLKSNKVSGSKEQEND